MTILDTNEIRRILPHRYPMLLVDRILELEPERIVGIKNVTANEPFFDGHFPDFPVMPGVLIVEAMAQTAGVLVLKSIEDRESKLVLLVSIEYAKFRRQVVPGDQLRMELTMMKREVSETRIGSRNKIREFVTIHRGTEGGGLVTRIGDDNLLMAYVHIAHDAQVGSGVIMGNGATLAGHVAVGDFAVIEAFSGVHQFCRIGRHAFVGGYSVITQDVLPYSSTVSERETRVFGANRVGLERRGFSTESIEQLQ